MVPTLHMGRDNTRRDKPVQNEPSWAYAEQVTWKSVQVMPSWALNMIPNLSERSTPIVAGHDV